MMIVQTDRDRKLLLDLLQNGTPALREQPQDYSGLVVLKPWGFECQVYDNKDCSIWLASVTPWQAVSMHCHQRKRAMFVPLSDNITLRTLDYELELRSSVTVDKGVFHSQENNSSQPVFFLEYEWPSEKSDLVRYRDRYGRERDGYEGKANMVPMKDFVLQLPESVRLLIGAAA